MPVLPGAAAIALDGATPLSEPSLARTGVLLCHGFTATPAGMRPWAERLAAAGTAVRAPLLPGHGTTWQDMNRTRWQDWYACVDRSFGELREACDTVVVGGLSMGGALALRLAQEHGDLVDGLVLVNPAVKLENRALALLPVVRRLMPSTSPIGNDISKPGEVEQAYDRTPLHALASMLSMYRLVVDALPRVTQPLRLYRSAVDHVVPASSSALVLERVGSTDVREVVLQRSFHVATQDHDAPLIFAGTIDLLRELVTPARVAS